MSGTRLTRRQALKTLLAAGGGIAAAAFLPAKWLKPIVSAGVLPGHFNSASPTRPAQASVW